MSESTEQHTDTSVDLMPIEKLWGRYMAQATQTLSVRTDCLTGPEIIELAERGEDSKEYTAHIEHIIVCTQCRRLLKESRALIKAATTVAQTDSNLLAVVKRALMLPAWMTLISISQPVPAARVGFSFAGTALLPTTLQFDNARARGSYITQDQNGYVHIEHPDLAPGTLVYIAFLDAVEEHRREKMGYFAVLMEDFCPSAEIRVPLEYISGSQVSISTVEPSLLPDASADALRNSIASTLAANDGEKRDATEEAWHTFARKVLKQQSLQTLAPRIRATFEELANQS